MNLKRWFHPPKFDQEELTRLSRNLFNMLVTILLLEVTYGLIMILPLTEDRTSDVVFLFLAIFITIMCYLLMQARRIRLSSLLLCLFLAGITLGSALESNGIDSLYIQTYTVVILIAGLLLGASYGISFAFVGTLCLFVIYIVETSGIIPILKTPFPPSLRIAIPAFVFIVAGLIFFNAIRDLMSALDRAKEDEIILREANVELRGINTTLEMRMESRTAQLNASNEIGKTLGSILDFEELGIQVTQKITSLFNYEHAAIYLVDATNQWATLKFSSNNLIPSESDFSRLDIRAPTPLGTAIGSHKPYLVNIGNIQEDDLPKFLVLPGVKSAIALPLIVARRTLGVLTIQSLSPNAFNPSNLEGLQNIANQIAISLENANLFRETQNQLFEINRLTQFYLQTTWQAFLSKKALAFNYSKGVAKALEIPDNQALNTAQQEKAIKFFQDGDRSTIIAPIMLQDQVLGALKLQSSTRTWTADDLNLIETVLNQTALSLENTRLMVETRNRAEQEKMLSAISNRMRETLDIETILQTTAREMQKALKLAEVEVRLLPDLSQMHGAFEENLDLSEE